MPNAVDAAVAAGASYADARGVFRRTQSVATKNGHVEAVSDAETEGIGVRVLVGGAWGFAADRRLTEEGARDAAIRACAFARARRRSHDGSRSDRAAARQLQGTRRDRSLLGVARREGGVLPRARSARSRRPEVKVAEASARALFERKVLVSSDGTDVEQELVECGGGIDAIAAADGS